MVARRDHASQLGLARALKLESIRRARREGIWQMRTNKHAENMPMVTGNRRLGFVPLNDRWELILLGFCGGGVQSDGQWRLTFVT